MKELIEALQIFLKYKDVAYPTHCEHDKLYICGYDDVEFSKEDKERLSELGFNIYKQGEPFDDEDPDNVSDDDEISSFRYGSA